jgi:hypothetical protein
MEVAILKLGARDGADPHVLGRTERRLAGAMDPRENMPDICDG